MSSGVTFDQDTVPECVYQASAGFHKPICRRDLVCTLERLSRGRGNHGPTTGTHWDGGLELPPGVISEDLTISIHVNFPVQTPVGQSQGDGRGAGFLTTSLQHISAGHQGSHLGVACKALPAAVSVLRTQGRGILCSTLQHC